MKALTKMLTGAAGLAAVVGFAAPAAAQYFPGYGNYGYGNGYGYNNGYSNGGTGVVGAIVNSIFGYGRYPYGNYGYGQTNYYNYNGQSQAVDLCARAAENRMNGGYGGYNGGYGYNGSYNGYNSGYGGYNGGYGRYNGGYGYNGNNGGYGQGRVVGISRVDRKNYGWHVYGVASTLPNNAPNLRIDCKVNDGGYVREVEVHRNMDGYRYGYGW